MLSKLSVNSGLTRTVFLALYFLMTTCPSYAGSGGVHMVKPQESLKSPLTQVQREQPQFGNVHIDGRTSYEPHQDSSQDLASLKKRDGIRKSISVMGYTFLLVASMVFASLGGAALSKTRGSEGTKKGIKWIVIALLLLVLMDYWDGIVRMAMSLFAG